MTTPKDVLCTKSHEWARIEGAEAVVGITQFAQEQLGDLTFVDLPQVGAKVAAGKEMGSVESVKAACDLFSPVTGEVLAVNGSLQDDPGLVNSDPFGQGWMVRVKLAGEPVGLMTAPEYDRYLETEAH